MKHNYYFFNPIASEDNIFHITDISQNFKEKLDRLVYFLIHINEYRIAGGVCIDKLIFVIH